MKALRMNLGLKATLLAMFVIFATTAIGIFFVKPLYQSLLIEHVLIIVAITILFSLLLCLYFIIDPLNGILLEVRALLTGRKYNKIFTQRIDEIGIVAHFFNEVTGSLERVSHDIRDQRRMSAELDIASKIQKDILPKEAPAIFGLTVLAKTRSAAEIGGDSFDFINGEQNTFIYLGDVTGHGVPSGLVMMMVDTLIHTFADIHDKADHILIDTNKYLKPRLSNTMFMTMVMFRWNHMARKMYVAGAGHENILVYRQAEHACRVERTGGIALGMVPDISKIAVEREISFEADDLLVIYSDGITEAKNISGEMFGLERLRAIVESCGEDGLSLTQSFQRLSDAFAHFTNKHVQEDDMSIIFMKQKGITDEHVFESIEWDARKLGKDSLVEYR
ncbi:PP2C family protein-serine/threonine phosphatase [Candidatus Peregrinibacteria bacterium]|nr:PP2C family protein-serine/threonine phosphatase [Candidatus Peregrinibacteria bacterium]